MGTTIQAENTVLSAPLDVQKIVRQISNSNNLEDACIIAEHYFQSKGSQLLFVDFCDTKNIKNIARPFRNLPDSVVKLDKELRDNGGCPVAREAIRLLRPFDLSEIDRSQYKDFLSNRFLDELGKLHSGKIFVVPVVLGQGLALFTVGSNTGTLNADDKLSVIDAVCQMSVALISRFPKVTTFFESKRLSTIEAEALFLNSNGYSDVEIAKFLNLNESTIGLLMKSVAKKLKARNRSQMIAIALALCEISNMQFREAI